ncbi:hypothetical protein C5167_015516 [Papaver somniferum]|uniref:Uncharacterized protein n=1 Tax=Papaver somniferum TaxID=3469 RepID=A0A4Y7JA60_PAPSO|nr:hypothetical protein C5167_015516 [Papaver somniferum]
MKQLRKLEKLCPLATIYCAGSRRKGSSVLVGFGFLLGVSVLIVTIIFLMFPSFINPMLQNNLHRFYQKIPFSHISSDSSNTSTSNSVTSNTFSSNPYQELNKSSTTQNQTVIVSSSPEITKELTQTDQTKSANYSSVVSGGPPKVEELGIPTSNFPSNSSRLYDAKQEIVAANSSSHGQQYCNIFDGEWVGPDNDNIREPFYPPGICPYMGRQPFDCYNNGRPDDAFLKLQWRWRSHPTNAGCNNNFPSALNASDFLERLRGKKVVFAGDSLNRNMFESLICIFWNAVPDKTKVHGLSRRFGFKMRGDKAYKYEDYNCTVGFVWSPFLVYETNPKNRRKNEPERMRLDVIDGRATSFYRDADLVIFDSWHWWVTDKTNNGSNYFQEGNYLHPKLEMREAYKKALTTWRKWMDKNIDPNKTQVVFRGYSASHFRGGKWNTGGKCSRETEPIMSSEPYIVKNPPQVKILEDTIRQMKMPVIYLNVSKLTYYRTDGPFNLCKRVENE